MISRQFLKSSLIYSVVGALPYVSGLVLIPFFIKELTPVQFSANALFITSLYFIQIITTFSLDFFVGVHYFDFKDDKRKLGEMMGTAIISLAILGISVLVIMLFAGKEIFLIVFRDNSLMQFFPFGLLTVMSAIFNGFIKTYSNLLINQQRPVRFFWLNFTNFAMVMIFSLILLTIFPYTLYGPILGRLFPALISFIIVILIMIKEMQLNWNSALIKSMASFCFPLLIYALAIWTVNYISYYVLNYYIPDRSIVGIFDFAVKITLVIEFFQIGLNSSIQPKLFNMWKDTGLKESNMEMNRYYNSLIGASILVIPILVLFVPLLVPFVITKKIYFLAFAFLPLLSLGFATRGWFYMFMSPLFFFRKTKVLPKVFLIAAVIQIIMTMVLIRYFSLWGAVWANFLIKPVQAFLLWLEARKVFTFRFNKWKVFYLPVLFILMFLMIQYLGRNLHPVITAGIQLIITVILVFFVYRNELIPMMRKILK